MQRAVRMNRSAFFTTCTLLGAALGVGAAMVTTNPPLVLPSDPVPSARATLTPPPAPKLKTQEKLPVTEYPSHNVNWPDPVDLGPARPTAVPTRTTSTPEPSPSATATPPRPQDDVEPTVDLPETPTAAPPPAPRWTTPLPPPVPSSQG